MLGFNPGASQGGFATPAGQAYSETAAPPRDAPHTLHVVGMDPGRENADICGEYRLCGKHCGYPAYKSISTSTAIRFCPSHSRWLMDRGGIRESDICVAYADAGQNAWSPTSYDLVWHVWDSRHSTFVHNEQVMATEEPLSITFVGRDVDLSNSACNGEYQLHCLRDGKPLYVHKAADMLIRYYAQEGRWLLSGKHDVGNMCMAYADGDDSPHPACPALRWHFWAPERQDWVFDQQAGAVDAPGSVHVVGRDEQFGNSRINGTYQMVAVFQGRPLYWQKGTQQIIRYSPKSDNWLIQCDGVPQPTRLKRFFTWIFNGDSSATEDTCTAFAKAYGRNHPAHAVQWQVFDTICGNFKPDSSVLVTAAPLVVNVSGRQDGRCCSIINGTYTLAAAINGYPAYKKVGAQLVLYHFRHNRWLIAKTVDLANSGVCMAYADSQSEEGHPDGLRSGWHVWENSRNLHLPDPSVLVTAATNAPASMSDLDESLREKGASDPVLQNRKRYREEDISEEHYLYASGLHKGSGKSARVTLPPPRVPPRPRSWLGA